LNNVKQMDNELQAGLVNLYPKVHAGVIPRQYWKAIGWRAVPFPSPCPLPKERVYPSALSEPAGVPRLEQGWPMVFPLLGERARVREKEALARQTSMCRKKTALIRDRFTTPVPG
jgi:hypothetical protein